VKKLILALACVLAGCGGSGPSSSTPPAPTPTPPVTAEFVNGLDHAQAVSGLTVTVDGVAVGTTGADGRTPSPVRTGARIQTSGRSDYINRDTLFASRAPQLPLWYLTGRWTRAYFQKLVYDYSGGDAADTTWDYLWCPVPGAHTVSVSDEIRDDPEALRCVNVAISEANRAEHGYLALRWADPGAKGDYHFEIDPADPQIAGAYAIFRMTRNGQGYMAGGTIVIESLRSAEIPTIAVHELGHGLGLQHSPYPGDVMNVARGRNMSVDRFSEGEEMAVVNIIQRKPGNRFPDTDPSVAGAALAVSPPAIVCGYRTRF
jgi:hypothetical protein